MNPRPRRYLFFVSHLYSLSILRPLETEARRRGDEVAWYLEGPGAQFLRPDERRLHSFDQVRDFQADATFSPGYWVPDFFPGAKVQVFHGLEVKKGDDHFRIRGLFDLYCTHGDLTTPRFEAEAERLGFFQVSQTGWPKLDPLFDGSTKRFQPAPPSDRPVILYTATFTKDLTSAPLLVDTIGALAASDEWDWLVTLHPKVPREVCEQYRALEGPRLTFLETDDVLPLLAAADVMLCDTSSIAFEFLLLDKPVVTFRNYAPGAHLLDVRETRDIEPALRQALGKPSELMEAVRSFGEFIHPHRDGRSSQRVLDATEGLTDHGLQRLRPKPRNLLRKLKIRRRMGYYRWT